MSGLHMSIAEYQRTVMGNQFDNDFMHSLAAIGSASPKLKWYTTTIVALAAMNLGDGIPAFYKRLLANYIPENARFSETQKIREALVKVSGVIGSAKAETALCALAMSTPVDLREQTHHRKNDDPEEAKKRGRALFDSIHNNAPDYDETKTLIASPDYYHIMMELTYGRILSFDGILNDMETHQAILASLMGNDCQEQVRDYAIGMMAQGVDREEIKSVRAIILNIAKHFEVTFYKDPAQIPSIAAVQTGTVPSWTEFMN